VYLNDKLGEGRTMPEGDQHCGRQLFGWSEEAGTPTPLYFYDVYSDSTSTAG